MAHEISFETLRSLPHVRRSVASPNGQRVAILCDRGRETTFYWVELDGATDEATVVESVPIDGEAVPASAGPHLAWDADSERVFVHRRQAPQARSDLYAIDRNGAEQILAHDGDCTLHDVAPDTLLYGRLSPAAGGEFESALYRYDRDSEETNRLVRVDSGEKEAEIAGAKLSPDGRYVAYTTTALTDPRAPTTYVREISASADADETGAELALAGVDGAAVRDWAESGRLLVSVSDVDRPGCGVVDLDPKDPLASLHGGPLGESAVTWLGNEHSEDRALEFLDATEPTVLGERVRDDGTQVPVVYGPDGATVVDAVGPGSADFDGEGYGTTLCDGTLLVNAQTPTARRRVFRYSHEDNDVEPFFEPGTAGIDADRLVDATHVTVDPADVDVTPAHDGIEESPVGGVYYAVGDDDSGPAVVVAPSSPDRTTLRRFDSQAQFLAGQGYSVLLVNHRGANDYLGPTAAETTGSLGRGEQFDIAVAADWLADQRGVDPDGVGVFGRRFGGYSVYCQLLDYPEHYACGVAWNGIADLSAYRDALAETSDTYSVKIRHRLAALLDDADTKPVSPVDRLDGGGSFDVPLAVITTAGRPALAEQFRTMRGRLESSSLTAGPDGDYETHGPDAPTGSVIDPLLTEFLRRRL